MSTLSVEPGEEKAPTTCECCGRPRYSAFGYVSADETPHAVYFATWSPGHPDQGVWLAVTLGDWSDSAGPEHRRIATMFCRPVNDRVEFSLTDTGSSPWTQSSFAGTKLSRAQTLIDPEVGEFFHVAERTATDDPRISRFLNGH